MKQQSTNPEIAPTHTPEIKPMPPQPLQPVTPQPEIKPNKNDPPPAKPPEEVPKKNQ